MMCVSLTTTSLLYFWAELVSTVTPFATRIAETAGAITWAVPVVSDEELSFPAEPTVLPTPWPRRNTECTSAFECFDPPESSDDAPERMRFAAAVVAEMARSDEAISDLSTFELSAETKEHLRPSSKTVVAILSRRMDKLAFCIDVLNRLYPAIHNHDIIVFHAGEFDEEDTLKLETLWPTLHIRVANLSETPAFWSLPPLPTLRTFDLSKAEMQNFGMGYRLMCRFYGRALFYFVYNLGYEWMIRFDDDSRVVTPIDYDLTERLEDRGAVYGYRLSHRDWPLAIRGCHDAVHEYILQMNVSPTMLYIDSNPHSLEGVFEPLWDPTAIDQGMASGWNPWLPYNNFFVTKLSFWMRREVQLFLFYVDLCGGFFYARWGDHIIQGTALTMFATRRELYWYDDFTYFHYPVMISGNNDDPGPVIAFAGAQRLRIIRVGNNLLAATPSYAVHMM